MTYESIAPAPPEKTHYEQAICLLSKIHAQHVVMRDAQETYAVTDRFLTLMAEAEELLR